MAIKLVESWTKLYPENKCENKIIMKHFLEKKVGLILHLIDVQDSPKQSNTHGEPLTGFLWGCYSNPLSTSNS